jgi:polyhydroxyalkanoate synthesis regulator phasin|tara:strand:- start:274 stop:495 length:222 start_codon:yes stop_codon:yes gene_type:complete
MNNEQKAQKYDWLTNQVNQIQRQINEVEKRPLEETLQDVNSVEYSVENQAKVNQLNEQLRMIHEDLRVLMTGI